MPTVDPRDAELAACPFCGSRASLEGVRDGCQVICNGNRREACFARGPVVYHGPGGWDACRAEAIAAWNRRTRPEPLAGSGVAGEEVERDIRISIWNGAKWQGSPDAVAQSLIRKIMDEPTMQRALSALRAHPAPEQSAHCSGEVVEVVARAMEPIVFGGRPDETAGPATKAKRAETRQKARLALAAIGPRAAVEEGYAEAVRLAKALWEKHFKDRAPHWKPLDTVAGVISQIDNMTAALSPTSPEASHD
jgi:hypothetical protein